MKLHLVILKSQEVVRNLLTLAQFKDTQIHNLGNFNQDQVEFLRQELQGSVRGFIDRTNLKESNQMPIDMLSNDLKELEVHAEQVTLGNNNEHGVLLPLKSKRYLVKQFDSKDFPDD